MTRAAFPQPHPSTSTIRSWSGMKKIFIFFGILSACEGTDIFHFVRDFSLEEYFWTPYYNIIECSEQNEIEWMRLLSVTFRGLLTIHQTREPLHVWVNITETQTFFLNVNCPDADSILNQADMLNLFGGSFKWLLLDDFVFGDRRTGEDIRNASESQNTSDSSNLLLSSSDLERKWYWNALKDYSVLLNSEVRMTEKMEEGTVRIVSAYKTWMDRELLREELAEWSLLKGLKLRTRNSTAIRRWDVRGAPLPGSFPITHPETLIHLEDMVDKHIDPICKVGYMLTKHFAEMINASLELKVVNTWGVQTNGTWTGMVGDIQSGVAEIGVSPAFVLEERMSIVKYYEMITPTRAKFIFLSPPLSFSSNIFAMPFDRMVWFASVFMIFISCIALYLSMKVERKMWRNPKDQNQDNIRNDELKDSFSDILMLNVGAICMQGAAAEPKGHAGRIIALFLYFSYMFLYVSYSGSIVALLQSSDNSIQTFKDLKDSSLSAGADDVVYSRYYFMTEKEPIRKALYEKKIAPKGEKPHFIPPEEGVKKIRSGLFAYHVEASVGYSLIQKTFTEEEKCGLQEFKTSFFQTVDPLLTMKFGSPYTEHLRVGMKRIIQTGLNHRALSRIYMKKPVCSSKGSRFVSVGLVDCYFAFFIVLYGILCASVILLIERLTYDRIRIFKLRLKKKKHEMDYSN